MSDSCVPQLEGDGEKADLEREMEQEGWERRKYRQVDIKDQGAMTKEVEKSGGREENKERVKGCPGQEKGRGEEDVGKIEIRHEQREKQDAWSSLSGSKAEGFIRQLSFDTEGLNEEEEERGWFPLLHPVSEQNRHNE